MKPSSSTASGFFASTTGAAAGVAASTVAGLTAFNAPVLIVDFSADVAPNARR
ncbi:hypothetical protein ABVN80_05875 [Acinetobacter baumannii]